MNKSSISKQFRTKSEICKIEGGAFNPGLSEGSSENTVKLNANQSIVDQLYQNIPEHMIIIDLNTAIEQIKVELKLDD